MVPAHRHTQQEQRLATLERRLAGTRWLAALALLLALLGTWIGARLPSGAVLRAERLVLSDAGGEGWIELGRIDGRPTIVVRDAQGRDRLKQFVSDQGPAIGLLDAGGDGWQGWFALSEAHPWIGLYDGARKIRAEMGVSEAGPVVAVNDAGGDVVGELFDPDARQAEARRRAAEQDAAAADAADGR